MHSIIREAFEQSLNKVPLSPNNALGLVNILDHALLDIASSARCMVSNNALSTFTCGIINAKSGKCKENCSFCAQSRHHQSSSPVYPLISQDQMVKQAETYAAAGVNYMGIVTSGTSPSRYDFERLCQTASFITERIDIKLCASLGLLSFEQAKILKQCGFSSYHHNLETSESFYPEICTTHPYAQRVETVRYAKEAGLRVCSGGIFGLGETWDQRIELSATLQKLDVDSIPINFLTPITGTPLEKNRLLSPKEGLSIIALFRLMHPAKDLVICGGRSKILQQWENMIFSSGANGVMVGNYLTTTGHALDSDLEMLRMSGLQ